MNRPALIAMLLAFAVSGCERPEPAERLPEAPDADPAMTATEQCINRVEGYAVEYPAGWHTNPGEVMDVCSLFDPEPITVPPGTQIPIDIAVSIRFEPVSYETVAGEVLGRRELSREETTVDGREAVRIESEATGEALYPAGLRAYQYFVDLGDTTMVAGTYDAGTFPYERKRRILDAMMATFDFRQPG